MSQTFSTFTQSIDARGGKGAQFQTEAFKSAEHPDVLVESILIKLIDEVEALKAGN